MRKYWSLAQVVFSQMYRDKSLFDVILPDLVLQGLQHAYEMAGR